MKELNNSFLGGRSISAQDIFNCGVANSREHLGEATYVEFVAGRTTGADSSATGTTGVESGGEGVLAGGRGVWLFAPFGYGL